MHQGILRATVKDWLLTHFVETQWAVLISAGILIALQLRSSTQERLFKDEDEITEEMVRPTSNKPQQKLTHPSSVSGPHQVLGVSVDATEEQILQAYRKAAKKVHPDLGPKVTLSSKKTEKTR